MARMISILLVLLMASPAWAFPPVMMGKATAAAATTAYCATCTGTCVYCEDFEGATDCDDATTDENCRYTYTDTIGAGGTLDYTTANTTVQCSSTATNAIGVTRSGADVSTLYNTGTSSTTVYISGYVKVVTSPTLAPGTSKQILTFLNATGTGHVFLEIKNDGGTYKFVFRHFNQSIAAVSTVGPAYSDGTWYRFRIYWKANQAGSGADWYVDSTQYTPADTSTFNSNIRSISYGSVTSADSAINYDNMRIQTDDYPACP